MDPFALPCHPPLRIDSTDRDWRAIGVKPTDGVRRKATRCPECKSTWTAFERSFDEVTVEWVQSVPFRVTAVPVAGAPLWQDLAVGAEGEPRDITEQELLARVSTYSDWSRSAQLVAVVQPVTAGGELFAQPGDLLLERREKWNAQDRRLALLWSARLDRAVVAWHSFARLPQA